MQIRVTCPECGKSFLIPAQFAGRDGECSQCQGIFHIPEDAPHVSDSGSAGKSGSVAAPPAPQQTTGSQRDAGGTEESALYSIDRGTTSDKSEAPEPQQSEPELAFDITASDLFPDEDVSADDDDVSVIQRALEAEASVDESAAESGSGDIVLKRGGGTQRSPSSGSVPKPKRRKRARQRDSQDESSETDVTRRRPSRERAGSSATLPSRGRPKRRRTSAAVDSVDAAEQQDFSDDEAVGEEKAAKASFLKRRISDEEQPQRTRQPDRHDSDASERPSRRPARKTDPRQLAILAGVGGLLLIGGGLYSHFSQPVAPHAPVLEGGPGVEAAPGELVSAGPAPVVPAASDQAGNEAQPPATAGPGRLDSTATAAARESSADGKPGSRATTQVAVNALPEFPELPEPRPSSVSGVSYFEIDLGAVDGNSGPGSQMQLILYLPAGEHAPGSLSCVLIAPAGTSLLEGAECFDESYQAETLPYVEAGFAVVGYSLDGALEEQPTDGEMNAAYRRFRAAQAGLFNARNALEFVLARVPQVSPDRIFSAGHSSAGTLSLLFAAHEPRLAGCIAFAPLSDPERRLKEYISSPAVKRVLPGVEEFVAFQSPLRTADRIACPIFLFHAADDSNVSVDDSQALVEVLTAADRKPEFRLVETGGHYDAMIQHGIPAAIEWMQNMGGTSVTLP
ncbi:MAG: alpha/beta hydrolase family protein [Planctomycetota bacterium]|jgi:dienelactone hydrolase